MPEHITFGFARLRQYLWLSYIAGSVSSRVLERTEGVLEAEMIDSWFKSLYELDIEALHKSITEPNYKKLNKIHLTQGKEKTRNTDIHK